MTHPVVVMTGPAAVTATDAAKADNRRYQPWLQPGFFSFCLETHML
jgi:hypothetical protein